MWVLILLLDIVFTGLVYLTPVLILRFAIFKQKINKKNAMRACFISAIVSHLLCMCVFYFVNGYVTGAENIAVAWVFVNYDILADDDTEQKTNKQKAVKKFFKVFFISISLLISIIAIVAILYFTFNNKPQKEIIHTEQTKPTNEPIIKTHQKKVSELPESGVIGEIKILGKHINSVIDGYKKGEDYTFENSTGYDTYTFNNVDYGIGINQSLLLSVDEKSNTISTIEFDFLIEDYNSFLGYSTLRDLEEKISNIYNTEPFYTWEDGSSGYSKSGSYDDLVYISWEVDRVNIILFFYNFNSNKNRPFSLFFGMDE